MMHLDSGFVNVMRILVVLIASLILFTISGYANKRVNSQPEVMTHGKISINPQNGP